MKQRDLILVAITIIVLGVAGFLAYTQLSPKKGAPSAAAGVTVEIVTPIASEFDQDALKQVVDPRVARDFSPQIKLDNLGRPTPFGQ